MAPKTPDIKHDLVQRERGVDSWFTAGRFAVVLGLLFALFFLPVVLGWEAFSFLDSGLFAYPVAYHLRESFWRGELPFWNPLSSCGTPFLAQWNTLALYPPSLFYILLPMPWSFNLFCLGHLVLGGAGMFLLARRWTGNQLASALAGVVFAFNGLTWWGLMWPHIIGAMAWMPWVILANERAWNEGAFSIVLASGLGALQMLSGGAEVILLTWLFLGALAAHALIRKEFAWQKFTARAAAIVGLVCALSAAQLMPFLQLLAQSDRQAGYGNGTIAAMAPTGWANYLLPLFHDCRNVQGISVPAKLSWTGSYYLGIGPILLAAYAVWKARGARVWLLLGAVVFSLLMALGSSGHFYDWLLGALPLLGFIRFPVKFVILATFAIPLLAAIGLAHLRESVSHQKSRDWFCFKTVSLGALIALGILAFRAWSAPLPSDDVPATLSNAASRALFIIAFAGALYLLLRRAPRRWRPLLEIGLVLLVWFDVYTQGSNLSPTVPSSVLKPNAVRGFFSWGERGLAPGSSRAMLSPKAMSKMLTAGSPDAVEDTRARRLALYMNYNLLDAVPKIDGLFSLDLRVFTPIRKIYLAENEPVRLEDFLAVSHVSSPTNATQWVRRDSFLPLITGGQRALFAGPEETAHAVFSDHFAPRQEVFLPPEARSRVGQRAPSPTLIANPHFSANHISAEIQAKAATMVVVAQTFYPCWRAYVDGKEAPIWNANLAFQAVAISAGNHRLELVYRDTMFLWGSIISGLAWVGCAVAAWAWRRRGKSLG